MDSSTCEATLNKTENYNSKASSYLEWRRKIELENFQMIYDEEIKSTLDYRMKLSSITLSPSANKMMKQNSDHNKKLLYNRLSFMNPFKSNNGDQCNASQRIFIILIHLLQITCSIDYFYIMTAHYIRDSKLEQLRLIELDSGLDNKSLKLITSNKSVKNNEDTLISLKESIRFYSRLLELINDPTICATGTSIISYLVCFVLIISYFYIGFLQVSFNNYRSDFCSFLINPVNEIMRVQKDLVDIMYSVVYMVNDANGALFKRSIKFRNYINHKSSSLRMNKQSKHNNELEHRYSIFFNDNNNNNIASSKINKNGKEVAFAKDLQLLEEILISIMELNLIRPKNMTKEYHAKLKRLFYRCTKMIRVFSLFVSVVFMVLNIILEVNIRVSQRLVSIPNCTRHLPAFQRDYNRDYYNLNPLETEDRLEFDNYCRKHYNNNSNNDNNVAKSFLYDYIGLHLIEFFYYAKLGSVTQWSIVTVYCVLICELMSLYISLHILSHYDRTEYLNQILQDMEYCIHSMYKFSQYSKNNSSDNVVCRFNSIGLNNHRLSEKFTLLRDITVCYLNYNLFFKQQKKFQYISNFFVLQGASLATIVLFGTYLIGENVRSDFNEIVLIITTYICIFINMYLLSTASMIKKIEQLGINVTRLLALSCESTPLNSHIFCLWRRSRLTQHESRQLYAPNIFGIYFGYERLLTINVYFILMWIILL